MRRLEGTIVGTFVCSPTVETLSEPAETLTVALDGIVGDRHRGFTRPAGGREPHYPRGTLMLNDRQISIVSVEELAEIASALGVPVIAPEWLGANLVVSGIPALSQIPPDSRLHVTDGPVLIVTRMNRPCVHPGVVLEARYRQIGVAPSAFPKAAFGRRGLIARPERAGVIHQRSSVRVQVYVQEQHPSVEYLTARAT